MFSRQTDFVISKFMRLAPWIEPDELRQEAALASLQAARTFRPTKGATLETYQARAVWYALSHHLDRLRSPVSASNGYVHRLRDLMSLPLQWGQGHDEEEETRLPLVVPAPERDMDLSSATAHLHALVSLSVAAKRVLLGEQKPAQVAKELRMPATLVYRRVRQARTLIARDERLRALVAR